MQRIVPEFLEVFRVAALRSKLLRLFPNKFVLMLGQALGCRIELVVAEFLQGFKCLFLTPPLLLIEQSQEGFETLRGYVFDEQLDENFPDFIRFTAGPGRQLWHQFGICLRLQNIDRHLALDFGHGLDKWQ